MAAVTFYEYEKGVRHFSAHFYWGEIRLDGRMYSGIGSNKKPAQASGLRFVFGKGINRF